MQALKMVNSDNLITFTTQMPGLVDISGRWDPFYLQGYTSTCNNPDSLYFPLLGLKSHEGLLSQAYFQFTTLNHTQI